MTRILKIAKLNQELTPHSLRHTHTSLLAEADVGLEEIIGTSRPFRRRYYKKSKRGFSKVHRTNEKPLILGAM
ncbi:MAG: hypothetical protein K0R55_1952 [Sporomusa sp.]|jgi:integrase|nr:hypothetical protein [Sporomusa sp.]